MDKSSHYIELSATEVAEYLDVNYQTFNFWLKKGYLGQKFVKPGKGKRRQFKFIDICTAKLFYEMMKITNRVPDAQITIDKFRITAAEYNNEKTGPSLTGMRGVDETVLVDEYIDSLYTAIEPSEIDTILLKIASDNVFICVPLAYSESANLFAFFKNRYGASESLFQNGSKTLSQTDDLILDQYSDFLKWVEKYMDEDIKSSVRRRIRKAEGRPFIVVPISKIIKDVKEYLDDFSKNPAGSNNS